MGPTRGPPGSRRPQMGPMLAPWISREGNLVVAGLETEVTDAVNPINHQVKTVRYLNRRMFGRSSGIIYQRDEINGWLHAGTDERWARLWNGIWKYGNLIQLRNNYRFPFRQSNTTDPFKFILFHRKIVVVDIKFSCSTRIRLTMKCVLSWDEANLYLL